MIGDQVAGTDQADKTTNNCLRRSRSSVVGQEGPAYLYPSLWPTSVELFTQPGLALAVVPSAPVFPAKKVCRGPIIFLHGASAESAYTILQPTQSYLSHRATPSSELRHNPSKQHTSTLYDPSPLIFLPIT